jgi:hypothetical protein
MKMLPALRQPLDVHLLHHHDTGAGFMVKRLGDKSLGPEHKVTWNYYIPRKRWEAVCEHTDVVFYAAAVPEDAGFRVGRSYDNCDGQITS